MREATRHTEGHIGPAIQLGCNSTMSTKGRPELPVTVPHAVQFPAGGRRELVHTIGLALGRLRFVLELQLSLLRITGQPGISEQCAPCISRSILHKTCRSAHRCSTSQPVPAIRAKALLAPLT